ncbi:MAG: hypothetical protein KA319_02980 [Ferruginibacter sp.]|nr:hypothetical protein [Ferruginibacter sp.]
MNKQEKINNLVNEALHSLDDVKQATGKPYLLTRINAKMQTNSSSVWDAVLAFISKPAVAFACIAIIIAINAMVLSNNNEANINTEDSYAIADEYNTSTIAINEIENIEP